jgi:hypothetical protein
MKLDFAAAFSAVILGLSALGMVASAFSTGEGYALPEKEQEKPVSVINVSALLKRVDSLEARVRALEATKPSAASKSGWSVRTEFSFNKGNP